MHFVARVQPSLDFSLTGISTLPSAKKDNKGAKVRAKREGGSNEEAERQ